MNALICYISVHHGNTKKVAEAMAGAIGAELCGPADLPAKDPTRYDLIGFGSGVYFGRHHKSLLAATESLPTLAGKKVFVFSTAGFCAARFLFHRAIRNVLAAKGAVPAGEFCCRGFDTYGIFGKLGGINKGHPNERDIARAVAFVKYL